MYKYIILSHIHISLARWNEINILFSKIELNTKINSSLRKFFVKYTLAQFHFRMAKMYLCLFSTPINEEILRNKAAIGGDMFNYHDFS